MKNSICGNCGSKLTKQENGYVCEYCGGTQEQLFNEGLSVEELELRKQERKQKKRKKNLTILIFAILLPPTILFSVIIPFLLRKWYWRKKKYGAIVKMDNLTEFAIPYGETTVKAYAFSKCTSLKSIVIPNTVTRIENHAFSNCESLKNIVIPDSVKDIGDEAFFCCYSLKWTKKDALNYLGNKNNPYLYLFCPSNSKITTAKIDVNCKIIASFAFCNRLFDVYRTMIIPYTSLTSVTIPNGVTRIGEFAFFGCSGLTSVVLGNGIKHIPSSTFSGCEALTMVYYNGTENDWKNISISLNNEPLTKAPRYYYSETKPTTAGSYWHYDTDGITPVIWE